MKTASVRFLVTAGLAASLAACGGRAPKPTPEGISKEEQARQAIAELGELVEKDKATFRAKYKTFEEFEKSEDFREMVRREPFPGGKYIINGDIPIADRKQLREYFENILSAQPQQDVPIDALAIHSPGGKDAKWSRLERKALSYCVSTRFGNRHGAVVAAMQEAASAWEAAADVDFTYQSGEDGRCDARNSRVIFDVNPVSGQNYLARAFFPNEPRPARNVLIDGSSFELRPGEELTLTGILRHELGHTLGFRHEHTRPEGAAKCFEDNDWRGITAPDLRSVMMYPQCQKPGQPSQGWGLKLTALDRQGAACVYGPAVGFRFDPGVCDNPPSAPPVNQGIPTTKTLLGQRVAQGGTAGYGPFSTVPGSVLRVEMTGAGRGGDPDLYVDFGRPPDPVNRLFRCRPFLTGPNETCVLDVPADQANAYVLVKGFTAGSFNLKVRYDRPK